MQLGKDTLRRYFLQQASKEEKNAIKNWLDGHQERKKEFVKERIYFDASLIADENQIISKKPTLRSFKLTPYLTIAASIVFVIISIYFFDLYKTNKLSEQLQTITTSLSSRAQITLPDGSQVYLNANSTIEYSLIFSAEQRKVSLNGEAFFDIIKSEVPFIVHTNKCDIEVLGTSFNVNAYNNEFRTSLFSGKVKLLSNDANIDDTYLVPGQVGESINGQIVVTHSIDMNSLKWKDGLIVLDNRSFKEITELLERYYGMEIIIKNKHVKSLGYVGNIRIIDGIEHALNVLKQGQSFNYKVDQQSQNVIIY